MCVDEHGSDHRRLLDKKKKKTNLIFVGTPGKILGKVWPEMLITERLLADQNLNNRDAKDKRGLVGILTHLNQLAFANCL